MNHKERDANRVTGRELLLVGLLLAVLAVGLLGALTAKQAQGAEVEVHRGFGLSTLHETEEGGVSVVRGRSNYPVYETRESETPEPATSTVDDWFKGYDRWRAREVRRKLYPRP